MRNSSEIWCKTSDISISLISEIATRQFNHGSVPTTVYISLDLLAELQKSTLSSMLHSGPGVLPVSHQITSIMTFSGPLNVSIVKKFKNFLLVGCQEDFDLLKMNNIDRMFLSNEELERIDKAFEDFVILEGES